MTLGFFSGTLTPSQWHDGVALLQRRSGIILPSFTVKSQSSVKAGIYNKCKINKKIKKNIKIKKNLI